MVILLRPVPSPRRMFIFDTAASLRSALGVPARALRARCALRRAIRVFSPSQTNILSNFHLHNFVANRHNVAVGGCWRDGSPAAGKVIAYLFCDGRKVGVARKKVGWGVCPVQKHSISDLPLSSTVPQDVRLRDTRYMGTVCSPLYSSQSMYLAPHELDSPSFGNYCRWAFARCPHVEMMLNCIAPRRFRSRVPRYADMCSRP